MPQTGEIKCICEKYAQEMTMNELLKKSRSGTYENKELEPRVLETCRGTYEKIEFRRYLIIHGNGQEI